MLLNLFSATRPRAHVLDVSCISFYSSPCDYLFTIASSAVATFLSFFFLRFIFFNYNLSDKPWHIIVWAADRKKFWGKRRSIRRVCFSYFNVVTHLLSSHHTHVLSWSASCHLLNMCWLTNIFFPSHEERNWTRACEWWETVQSSWIES